MVSVEIETRTLPGFQPLNPRSWIKFNIDGNGYYRVNYPPNMWAAISNALRINNSVSSFYTCGTTHIQELLSFLHPLVEKSH